MSRWYPTHDAGCSCEACNVAEARASGYANGLEDGLTKAVGEFAIERTRYRRALLPFAAYADAVDKANGATVLPGHFAMVQPRLKRAGVEIGHEHFFAAREALDPAWAQNAEKPAHLGGGGGLEK